MKIRKRLYINAAVSIITAAILFFMLFVFYRNMEVELEKFAAANDLVKKTTDLIIITNEYLTNHSERSERQWYFNLLQQLKMKYVQYSQKTLMLFWYSL